MSSTAETRGDTAAGPVPEHELLSVTIDGSKARFPKGTTILVAAKELGIRIPTLCNDPRLAPWGGCRMCLVEVKGARCPVVSCATKVTDGMVVRTDTPEIRRLRKTVLELILSDHPNACMTCDATGSCELQDLAYEYGASWDRFSVAVDGAGNVVAGVTPSQAAADPNLKLRPAEVGSRHVDDDNPFIFREYEKCILCGRCVRICDEVQQDHVYEFFGRGFVEKVSTPYDRGLLDTQCSLCGQCVSTCPTGALLPKQSLGKGRSWQVERTKTVCPYCGCGCVIELSHRDGRIVGVAGVRDEGPGWGNLCIKGRFAWQYVNSPDRLTAPLIRARVAHDHGIQGSTSEKHPGFCEVGWAEALHLVADCLSAVRAEYGPDAIAGLASAKCTNEENYAFQKLFRAVIGTNNVDHCARLCHSPTLAGLAATFGSGAMTNSIADLATSQVILVIGSNTTDAHPIIALHLKQAVSRGAKLIVCDPRKIRLTLWAHKWVRQRPGTDVALLNGIMNVILAEGLADWDFIRERTEGIEELRAVVEEWSPERAADVTGVDAEDIREIARVYAGAERSSILYAMGITQHTSGVDNVHSVANLAMLAGQVGRPGTGVNPLRGQSNVQGACDAGALFNFYPGYGPVDDPDVRKKFKEAWGVAGLPDRPGLSVVEMIDAAHEGGVRAMYIMGENPVLSDPDVEHVREGLEALDFLVVQDLFMTETARLADVVLPAASFAEKTGTFTNTERRVQLVRRAFAPPGDALDDLTIINALARTLTGAAGGVTSNDPYEVMVEMAGVIPQYAGITCERLESGGIPWPCPSVDHPGTPTLHADKFARGLGCFKPADFRPPAEEPDEDYPLLLTTGRVLEQYHTGSMSRRAVGIDQVAPPGYVDINPADAGRLGLSTDDEVIVATRRGEVPARANVTDHVPAGVVYMSFHYSEAPANALTISVLDPVAKIPELKVCAARVTPVGAA